MKSGLFSLVIGLAVSTCMARGQAIFIYDQQSSDESNIREGGAHIQESQPFGQSFTPLLSSIGFIRLYVGDSPFGNNVGATLFVNLRADSITGPILNSTDPVVLPDRFAAPVDFFFSNPVPLTPGVTYYFQPVVQAGDDAVVNGSDYNYGGGTVFGQGMAVPSRDLWFREGIVVPEPSSAWLMGVGVGAVLYALRRQIKKTFVQGPGY